MIPIMLDQTELQNTIQAKIEAQKSKPLKKPKQTLVPPVKQRKPYNHITPVDVARFQAETAITHNRTEAIRNLYPELISPKDRAYKMAKRAEALELGDAKGYIENRMTELALNSIDRIGELVESDNEVVAGTNARYLIDHVQGQAVKRSINRNENITLEALLNGS